MKQLKQRSLLFMLFLLAIAGLGLTSCSGDDLESNPSDNNSRFYVSVTDGGYFSTQDGIYTKSSEQGYTTEFTAGDQIGVFAVKNNQIIAEVNNLCLTATDNNGALVWKDAGGNAPLKFDGAVYYGYYPYQSSLTGTLVLTATDADSFFVNVVSNWMPSTDQGVYTKYTAQDLMTAKGAISNNELSFAMQHEMALAVIELPGTKYEFSNSPAIADYITDPLDTKFDGYTPYRMSDGTYRYLVRPASTNKLTGSYTTPLGVDKGWEVTPTIASASRYKTFTIDGGQITVPSYNLQPGDYMLKNGSLVSKDVTLSPTQKANCIGVVFWIDPNGVNHGKVVGLQESSNLMWADFNTNIGALSETNGQANMQAVAAYIANATNGKVWSNFPAFEWVHNMNDTGEDYTDTSAKGVWYLPAEKELGNYTGGLYQAKAAVNAGLTSVGGTAINAVRYWSSLEVNSSLSYSVDLFGITYNDNKDGNYSVRCVLAF